MCSKLNNIEYTAMVFCDIAKAFDRVWHKGLLAKLHSYCVRGDLLQWIESYKGERRQKVIVNKAVFV